MANKLDNRPSKSPNPGDNHASKLFPDDGAYVSSGLDQLEAYANDDSNQEADDIDSVREREQSASDTHKIIDNFSGNLNGKGRTNAKGNLRKSGPIGMLLTAIIAIAGIVGFFGGPSMLILDIAEKMTDKFNHQLASMDARTTKIMNAKFKNTTSGCSKLSPAICKYSTLSEKTVKNIKDLKKRGVDIDLEVNVAAAEGSGFSSKRYKIQSIKWKGQVVDASDFAKLARTTPDFANAMRRIYNPKFVGLADGVSAKVRNFLKILKKAPFEPDTTDEQKRRAVVETTQEGRTSLTSRITNGDIDPNCTEKCDELAPDQDGKVGGVVDDINNLANETDSSGIKQTTKVFGDLAREGLGKAANTIGALGIMGDGCSIYGMFKAVGTGIKLIRNNQAARFAMIFLTTASMIRASTDASAKGDLTPEVTNFIGSTLTTTFVNSDGTTTKSATDSFGYRYAAHGDTSVDDNASQYLAGAGLGGSMSGVMGLVIDLLGRSIAAADNTCKVVNNPAVQVGSFAAGVALLLIPGGQAVSIGKMAGQAAFGAATFAAQLVLPSMLADIIAGKLVDESTVGESAGNIITVGAGHMLGLTALRGGNAILKPSQARKVRAQQVEVLARYAEEDRRNYSPFDATNKNTFMGNIRSQLIPILNSSSSTNLASVSSSLFGSIAKLMPSVGAAPQETFTECQDTEYRIIDLATDPLCNPIYGIPPEYLGKEPIDIFNSLQSRGFVDNNGTPLQPYLDFIASCVDRAIPYGSTGEDSQMSRGEECFIENQDQADQYIYLIDQRVIVTMDGDDPVLEGTGAVANINTSGAIGPANRERAVESWGGYKNGEISESALHSISQAPDATAMLDIKAFLSTRSGGPISDSDITTTFSGCNVPSYDDSGNPKVGSKPFMHPKAFVSFVALNAAYKSKFGNDIQLISCYRDLEGQKSAKEYWTRKGAPGNAADPGTSNHGWGIALDIGPGGTGSGFRYRTPEYVWMMANAPQFGWVNPKNMQENGDGPYEPWHWEYARDV